MVAIREEWVAGDATRFLESLDNTKCPKQARAYGTRFSCIFTFTDDVTSREWTARFWDCWTTQHLDGFGKSLSARSSASRVLGRALPSPAG